MIEIKLLIFCLFMINTTVAKANLNIDENGNYRVDDMIMSPNQYSPISNHGQESGQKDLKYRWPNGVVPYKIENSFNDHDRAVIEDTIKSLNQELGGCIEIR